MNARRLFSNLSLVVIFSTGFVGASLALSYSTGKWHWFGRSGAIATMAGVLLSVRPLVRMGFAEWVAYTSTIDGGHAVPTPEEVEVSRQANLDAKAARIGAFLAVTGTLIWAYGDLLGGIPR
jgi:hypothetical protein